MEYNYIDVVIALILAYGVIRGGINGFIVEIASLLALILGVWGAIQFSDVVGEYLVQHVQLEEKYISLSSFIITFLGIVIAISYLGKALTSIASVIALGWLNRLLGALFGILKYGFMLSIVAVIFLQINSQFEIVEREKLKESILFEDVAKFAPTIIPALRDIEVQEWWDKAYERIEDSIEEI